MKIFAASTLTILCLLYSVPVLSLEHSEELEAETKMWTEEEELLLFFEESVITATRTKKKAQNVPVTVTVITAEQIRNMGARDLMDVLRIVPGLNIARHNFGIWEEIEVRGIKNIFSKKVLLLQDGHVLNNSYDGGPTRYFDDLVVNNIKQVEIIRGPLSAIYGNNAFSAVINIITKKAIDIRGVELKAGGGSFETLQYSVLFGYTIDKFGISGYFDYLDTNGPKSNVEKDSLSPAPFSEAPGHTQEWREKQDFNLNLSYGDFTLWGKYLEKKRGPYIGAGPTLNDESIMINRNIYGELVFDHSFEDQSNVMTRLYGNRVDEDLHWELLPEGVPGFPDGKIGSPRFITDTFGGELKVDYKLWNLNLITAGVLYEEIRQHDVKHYTNYNPNNGAPLPGGFQDITDWANFNRDINRRLWAFYFQNDLDLLSDYGIELLLGIRYDEYSDFGGAVSPQTGLVWRIVPDVDFRILYGNAFRAPNFAELYTENNPVIEGNPDLDPERSWTTEGGLVYRLTPQINIELTYFHTEIEDQIRLESQKHVNAGGIITQGVETEIKVNLGEGYYGFANYTYQEPREFGEDFVPDVPKHLANAGINLNLWDYVNSNTTVHFTGPRPRDKRDSRDELPSYVSFNQTIIVKNFLKTLELRASIYNLFNENYDDPAPINTIENDFPRPGRHYFFEAAYKF